MCPQEILASAQYSEVLERLTRPLVMKGSVASQCIRKLTSVAELDDTQVGALAIQAEAVGSRKRARDDPVPSMTP